MSTLADERLEALFGADALEKLDGQIAQRRSAAQRAVGREAEYAKQRPEAAKVLRTAAKTLQDEQDRALAELAVFTERLEHVRVAWTAYNAAASVARRVGAEHVHVPPVAVKAQQSRELRHLLDEFRTAARVQDW